MIKEYGYEYDAKYEIGKYSNEEGFSTYEKLNNALCLRSGRDALKMIAREYDKTKVFLPALSCESMILPFEMFGHEVIFYKLNDDYTIDIGYLKNELENIKDISLFLYMDYFGIECTADANLIYLKEKYPKLVFIEDRTHNIIWNRKRSFEPEYIMASIRKWINIPDGGLLWSNHAFKNKKIISDSEFALEKAKAQGMRWEYFRIGDEEIKSEYRKIFSEVSNILDKDTKVCRMSKYSFNKICRADWKMIREQRMNNSRRLISYLKKANAKLIQDSVGISDLYVPFLVDNRNEIQNILSKMGIFNTIIWPLSDKQRKTCSVSEKTEMYMLAAPCDQRYVEEDMKFIGEKFVEVIR